MMATRRALSAAAAAAAGGGARRPKRTLALSVHFLQPSFGMRRHEILSRATAFLLAVDPPDEDSASSRGTGTGVVTETADDLIRRREAERDARRLRRHYLPEPAGGPRRDVRDLGWLEFCPSRHRPIAHVVAASHVVAPWKWREYYPHGWLSRVDLEHCAYSLEVYDAEEGKGSAEALAKFALNPFPIHHPTGMDLAVMHIKQEETALKQMRDLGVELLHLRDDDVLFERGEEVLFEGFEVAEENAVDGTEAPERRRRGKSDGADDDDDVRTFLPFSEPGRLIFASPQRVLAETNRPLPEGLCGGPTIDSSGRVCGAVEGIVPMSHDDERLRGAAAFLPGPAVRDFVQWAERGMLERILPKKLFGQVCDLKAGKKLNEDAQQFDADKADREWRKKKAEAEAGGKGGGPQGLEGGELLKAEAAKVERAYETMVSSLKDSHSEHEVEAIMATIERERQEVLDAMTREGGDLDEVIAKVRRRTRERQREILQEVKREAMAEGEIVEEEETKEKEEEEGGRKSEGVEKS